MATETSTLLSTQNADNVNFTGGVTSNLSQNGGTLSGATILALAAAIVPAAGYTGTVTLNDTTGVTVSGAAILTSSIIVMSPATVAVRTSTAPPTVTAITTGQFVVTGAASDSSVMNWAIIRTV